jgi:competence CoiA-like predicted nuclease
VIQAKAIEQGTLIEATPGSKALCPICRMRVRARCGSIKAWHWAHVSLADCDFFSEGETEWHLGWKKTVLKNRREVTMENHRADIVGNGGIVIELQNSPISLEALHEREKFYGRNMIWLINATSKSTGFDVTILDGGRFKWKNQTFRNSDRKVFFDCGSFIFEVSKFHDEFSISENSGKGRKLLVERFFLEYLSEVTIERLQYNEEELRRREEELFLNDVEPVCRQKRMQREELEQRERLWKMYRTRERERLREYESSLKHHYCLTCKTEFADARAAWQHMISGYGHEVRIG